VACEIVTAVQALVTRRFAATEAVVITVTTLESGTAHNIIPDRAHLKGTIRTLTPERRDEVREALRTLAAHIAQAHECSAEVTITEGFPPTINDPRAVALFADVAGGLPDGTFETLTAPIMGAEDFSYVLEKVPGAMAFLGVAPDGSDWASCCGIHSSRMMVDEKALPRGAAVLAGCALRFLEHRTGNRRIDHGRVPRRRLMHQPDIVVGQDRDADDFHHLKPYVRASYPSSLNSIRQKP
jgi:hippurate hydrolase